jgi:hypothetical protein
MSSTNPTVVVSGTSTPQQSKTPDYSAWFNALKSIFESFSLKKKKTKELMVGSFRFFLSC